MESAATPPAPAPSPAPRLTVGGVIREAFDLYGAHAVTLIGAAIGIFVISGVIQGLLNDADSWVLDLLGSLVSLIASTLYTGFVVTLVDDVRDGKRDFTVGGMLSSASHAIPALIVMSILFGLGVGIGLILLIVPGLYLLTIWSVAAPAIVVERRGAIESFGRSHELVKGEGWTVFGAIVVAFLVLIGFAIIAAAVGAAIGDVAGAIILVIIANTLSAPFAALVSSVLFFELRGPTPATDTPVAPTAPAA